MKQKRKLRKKRIKEDLLFRKWLENEYKAIVMLDSGKPLRLKVYLNLKKKYPYTWFVFKPSFEGF